MPMRYVISATGTDVGKTVTAGVLMLGMNASYWKPVQCGAEPETDTRTLRRLTGLPPERFLPEAYVFKNALSPHRAAELENREIDFDNLDPPACHRTLLIEGAGGLMVPLTRDKLFIDLMTRWKFPLILCARTELGTINHTLLSLAAAKSRGIPLHGVIFIGPENEDNINTIAHFSGAPVLGHIPLLQKLTPASFSAAFTHGFNRAMLAA